MKLIIVLVFKVREPANLSGYPIEMRILYSTHPRFVTGTRFDWGFATLAVTEGYAVDLKPTGTYWEDQTCS